MQQEAERFLREHLEDERAFVDLIAQYPGEISTVEAEHARTEMITAIEEGRLRNRAERANALALVIDGWLAAAEHPLKMTWILAQSTEDQFIISDSGFAAVPSPEHADSTETYLPLAHDACLVMIDGVHGLWRVAPPAEAVRQTNLNIYGFAERFIYGPTEALVTGVRDYAVAHPERIPRPAATL